MEKKKKISQGTSVAVIDSVQLKVNVNVNVDLASGCAFCSG